MLKTLEDLTVRKMKKKKTKIEGPPHNSGSKHTNKLLYAKHFACVEDL